MSAQIHKLNTASRGCSTVEAIVRCAAVATIAGVGYLLLGLHDGGGAQANRSQAAQSRSVEAASAVDTGASEFPSPSAAATEGNVVDMTY